MGNSCCLYASSEDLTVKSVKDGGRGSQANDFDLPHISDREDLSNHAGTLFLQRSQSKIKKQAVNGISRSRRHTIMYAGDRDSGRGSGGSLRKANSCSTIFIDDNTVSQPNLKAMLKCVSLAVYYHIKNRDERCRLLDIFDEKQHPLSKDPVPDNYDRINPEHRHIYRFIKTLFSAAQLTAECAIITLVYLERLLTYGEIDLHPSNWKRAVLGGILLASKVWDDQAVWNVDYCQILRDITVEDMNELERSFLELLQFNINVPSSVYAKYYFDLRALAEKNDLTFPLELLDNDKARRLEAITRVCKDNMEEINKKVLNRSSSMDDLIRKRRSMAIIS